MRTLPAMRTTRPVLGPLLAGLLLAVVGVARPAGAGAAEEPHRLRYQIEVAGVQVGEIEVDARRGERTARARVGWEMDGLFGLLERGEGTLEGRGRVVGDGGDVAPALFQGRFEKPDREREVVIRYGEDGAISSLRLTNNGERRKSGVPEDLRRDTVDTLTAFWRLRRWAVEAGGDAGPLVVPVFDGRRRYDLHARRLGRTTAERDGRSVDAVRMELRLVPRAGFDEDGRVFGSRVDPEKPWAEVVVSAGDDPVPLEATGTGRLAWRIVLDED
jgi:Protein of unknown function (DUF3108)